MKSIKTCSGTADYSKVTGDRILPFLFVLNEADSVLNPVEDDLSHFVLGICKDISSENIAAISVIINGVTQDVVLGENVEILTEENPDPTTECAGIKFDFPLDKVEGEMQVCITFTQTYPVGPVNVCVFGGNTVATGLTMKYSCYRINNLWTCMWIISKL